MLVRLMLVRLAEYLDSPIIVWNWFRYALPEMWCRYRHKRIINWNWRNYTCAECFRRYEI